MRTIYNDMYLRIIKNNLALNVIFIIAIIVAAIGLPALKQDGTQDLRGDKLVFAQDVLFRARVALDNPFETIFLKRKFVIRDIKENQNNQCKFKYSAKIDVYAVFGIKYTEFNVNCDEVN